MNLHLNENRQNCCFENYTLYFVLISTTISYFQLKNFDSEIAHTVSLLYICGTEIEKLNYKMQNFL